MDDKTIKVAGSDGVMRVQGLINALSNLPMDAEVRVIKVKGGVEANVSAQYVEYSEIGPLHYVELKG